MKKLVTPAAAKVVAPSLSQLKTAFFQEVAKQAASVAKTMGINNILPVDLGNIGALPWYCTNGSIFNNDTYTWINKVIKYNPAGYYETDGSEFTTEYYNVMQGITYQLSPANQSLLNTAINNANSIVNTLVTNYTSTFGAIPATNAANLSSKLTYITTQMLSWTTTGTTLNDLYSAVNINKYFTNAPLGSATVITNLSQYLGATASVKNLQASLTNNIGEITGILNNLAPAPSTVESGWMQTQDSTGANYIVPELSVAQNVSVIQNGLNGTNSFSVSMYITKVDSSTMSVSINGGTAFSANIADLIDFGFTGSASYNSFSIDSTTTSCNITITFSGITTFTPSPQAYSVLTNSGWWAPNKIKQALSNTAGGNGLVFALGIPPYNFGENGDFGFINNLLISNPPTLTLEYDNANYNQINTSLSATADLNIDFLGIGFIAGSTSYYKSTVAKTASGNGVSISLAPNLAATPVPTLLQQAYVIGADVVWPGA